MTKKIRFSIVIACYNQESFIRETVESALSQRYPYKEIIVVDDCSSDSTANILRTFGASIKLAVLTKNGGVYESRNHGAAMANGDYVVFLDGDDVMMPWTLDIYDHLVTDRHPQIILGRPVQFYGKVPEISTNDIPKSIQFIDYTRFLAKDRPAIYNTSVLVVDRSHFWSVKGWSHGIFYQDIQDLLIKLGTSGRTVLVLEPGTVWYRIHSTNASHNVSSFVKGLHILFNNARVGSYPGGPVCWLERSVWFGGLVFYWVKKSIQAKNYRDGLSLLASGWWMILLALAKRGTVLLLGRKPIEQLPFQHVKTL